jgi:hypothetical protein
MRARTELTAPDEPAERAGGDDREPPAAGAAEMIEVRRAASAPLKRAPLPTVSSQMQAGCGASRRSGHLCIATTKVGAFGPTNACQDAFDNAHQPDGIEAVDAGHLFTCRAVCYRAR